MLISSPDHPSQLVILFNRLNVLLFPQSVLRTLTTAVTTLVHAQVHVLPELAMKRIVEQKKAVFVIRASSTILQPTSVWKLHHVLAVSILATDKSLK